MKHRMAWREAVWIFGLSRVLILLASYMSVRLIPIFTTYSAPQAVTRGCNATLNCLLDAWWRWDVVYYVEIAHDGYATAQHTVFFPLMPLLMHTLGALFGGSERTDYLAGLIISNICFYGSLVLLYQLVHKHFDAAVARRTLLLAAFAPYSIFFFAGYTESLFLLLCLATFLFLERGGTLNWWLAGVCGLLATLTRATGVILLVPFLVVFAQTFGVRSAPTRDYWRQKLNALLSMALVPAGIALYMLYLWIIFKNPLIFQGEEARGWMRYTTFPWVGSMHVFQTFFSSNLSVILLNLRDIFFTFLPLLTLLIGWKHLPLRYSTFSLFMILFVLSNPLKTDEALASAPRYMMVIFPVFLLLALLSKRRLLMTLLAPLWSIAFIAITIVFVSGYWIA